MIFSSSKLPNPASHRNPADYSFLLPPHLLHLPMVFTSFPLDNITYSCKFTIFFQHFYGIVTVCSQQSFRFPPFSKGFCTISFDRYDIFLQLHCIVQYIFFVGFQSIWSKILLTISFLPFSPLSSMGFCTIFL